MATVIIVIIMMTVTRPGVGAVRGVDDLLSIGNPLVSLRRRDVTFSWWHARGPLGEHLLLEVFQLFHGMFDMLAVLLVRRFLEFRARYVTESGRASSSVISAGRPTGLARTRHECTWPR